MDKREFNDFMNSQIFEIKKYLDTKMFSNTMEKNTLIFEWIEANAGNFRENWYNK